MAPFVTRRTAWAGVFLLSIVMQREVAACGQLQNVLVPHITKGHDTHRWPWHAAIFHQYNETDSAYQCGGTLVSSKFILTAAHCVEVEAEEIAVTLGRLHLNADHDSAPFVKVDEIFLHPLYTPENYANDIAILTLSTDVIFNSYVQPICMWKSDRIDLSVVIGQVGTVVGWGLTENGETPNVLQEASLPVVPSFTCLSSNRDLFGRFLTGANFCAGTRNGTSVCTGDSGGSITFQENGRYYIRGVVSVGAQKLVDRKTNKLVCDAMQYAVFTDVAQYLPWIRETIGCEAIVPCVWTRTDLCALFVTVDTSDCKIILDETESVDVKTLQVRGRYNSIAIPDLSNAVDTFRSLEALILRLFIRIERSRLSPFRKISRLTLELFSNIQLDVDTFVDLKNLEKLTIKYCNSTTLPARIFRNNKKIRHISLYANSLTNLHPDVFEKLRNLEEFFLLRNELGALPSNIFRNNGKMHTLTMPYNELTEVHEDLFNGLTNLENLDLSYNDIEYIPSHLFRSNSKLTSIDLSNNKIKKIEVDLTSMPQLRFFYLNGNECIDQNFEIQQDSLSVANDNIRTNCTN